MLISNPSERLATAAGARLAGAAGATGSPLSPAVLGKEDFLRLLTVQLAHQDPLDPVSNEAFVAQLAQFSALEEMQSMNQGLAASRLLEESINNSLATGLIGREVRAEGDAVRLSGDGPAEFTVDLAAPARVAVTVRDAAGAVVRTLAIGALPAGESRVLWDGRSDAGERLAAGEYRVSVEAVDGSGAPVAATTATAGEVTGLRFLSGRTYLVVNGREVPLEDVREIRSRGED